MLNFFSILYPYYFQEKSTFNFKINNYLKIPYYTKLFLKNYAIYTFITLIIYFSCDIIKMFEERVKKYSKLYDKLKETYWSC